jgi:hypothetical protein
MPDDAKQRVRERQDGGYTPPVLAEPVGGPIPPWRPEDVPPREGE